MFSKKIQRIAIVESGNLGSLLPGSAGRPSPPPSVKIAIRSFVTLDDHVSLFKIDG